MPEGALPELSEGYAKLDEKANSLINFTNNRAISVTGFLVPNDDTRGDRFDATKTIVLNYNKDIKELKIDENVYQFGISGTAVLEDEFGKLNFLFEDYNFYHFVVNIYEQFDESGNKLKVEPYIFHITSVEPISRPDEPIKKLLIKFIDIISYEAMTHQFASLLKFDTSFKEATSYPDAFKRLITYVLDLIKLNGKNTFEYRKEFKFFNDYDTDDNSLLKLTWDKIDEATNLYDVLNIMTRDACVAMKPEGGLIGNFESIGDVRIPVFCRQEVTDFGGSYYSKYAENEDNVVRVFPTKTGETVYYYRPYTFRSFYMPFQLAFEDGLIYEAFNSSKETNEPNNTSYMHGNSTVPLSGLDVLPTNAQTVANRWKNMIFMACEGGQATSQLVFFNWLYEYFNTVFVGGRLNTTRDKFSNVIPPFYFIEKSMGGAGDDFQKFSEINSNVFPIRTKEGDPTLEILMEMGKTIASFVFLNTTYSFNVPGDIFRHPNEIIKISRESHMEQANVPVFTDWAMSEFVYLYVSQVSHYFHGQQFDTHLICNRIYERDNNPS